MVLENSKEFRWLHEFCLPSTISDLLVRTSSLGMISHGIYASLRGQVTCLWVGHISAALPPSNLSANQKPGCEKPTHSLMEKCHPCQGTEAWQRLVVENHSCSRVMSKGKSHPRWLSYSFSCPINNHIFGEENESKILRGGNSNRKKGTMQNKDLSSILLCKILLILLCNQAITFHFTCLKVSPDA